MSEANQPFVKVTIIVEDSTGQKTTYSVPLANDVQLTTETSTTSGSHGFQASSTALALTLIGEFDASQNHILTIETEKRGEEPTKRTIK